MLSDSHVSSLVPHLRATEMETGIHHTFTGHRSLTLNLPAHSLPFLPGLVPLPASALLGALSA